MRFWLAASLLALGLASAAPAHAQADFDPSGRRRAPRGATRGRGGGGGAGTGEKKKPNTEALIERYTKALVSNPSSQFPLQKLTELYRGRDGNLDKLVSDFERRASEAAGEDQVNVRLALAGVYLAARKRDEAARILDELTRSRPTLAAPLLMRAALAEREGDRPTARRHFESALPLVQEPSERERITRQLMLLALDSNDLPAAAVRHGELVRLAGGSLVVRKELGVELMNRGNFAAAEAQFREVVKAAVGDNRALAPALRDLGESLARQKKLDEAHEVLERARAAAGEQSGIRNEILALLTEIYREQGKLAELVAILEREGGRDAARLFTVAQLLEETGQVEAAIRRYREALALDPRHVDARTRLVHLLQAAGLLDDAVREYEALIKASPDSAEHVFELAETWLQRGEREKALALVSELERRSTKKPDVLASVADFYERTEEPARALKVFERLAGMPEGDPRYLVDLGDRYFQAGDRDRAVATWRRVLAVTPVRAEGLQTLGEVFLEHDMPDEALTELREAVKASPAGREVRFKKALASALERAGTNAPSSQARYREALGIWQDLLARAGDDALLGRDCRNHLVNLWGLLRELDAQVRPLKSKFDGTPSDLEAGRLLGEVLRRLGKLGDAEATLRRLVTLAPGDTGSMLALERVLVLQRNLAGAIEVLAKVVEADPKSAREHYQRMAQYAAELYRDDDAIEYASRALELSPGDADGHYRLATMHRRRQERDRAARELRKAIAKNPKLHHAYFELAELVLAAGDADEADRLYRSVIRTARDEEFIVRAARLSMQLHLGRGTLEVLERELLPLALGNPQRSAYRRMLVELYGNLTGPLVRAVHHGSGSEVVEARERLAAIGARAVKPLLDALVDDRAAQQRIAIEVLAHVENKGAGPALFTFATSDAEPDLRVRAMLACGALDDPQLLPRYREWLAPEDSTPSLAPGDPVVIAAVWGVANLVAAHANVAEADSTVKAEALLGQLLESGSVDVRAIAALGLGFSHRAVHAAMLERMARAPETGTLARAAAAVALGELGGGASRQTLLALTDASDVELQRAAIGALVRLELTREGDASRGGERTIAPDVATVLAKAVWSPSPETRRSAIDAASALLARNPVRSSREAFSGSRSTIRARSLVEEMAPRGGSRDDAIRALDSLKAPLAEAARAVVVASPVGAEVVATLLVSRFEAVLPALGATVEVAALESKRADLVSTVASRTVEAFASLVRHPAAEVRRRAVEVLAGRPEPSAREALRFALEPSDPVTCRAALGALEAPVDEGVVAAVVAILDGKAEWSLRALAAETLGRVARGQGSVGSVIDAALRRAATGDRFALVREAALRALFARASAVAPLVARDRQTTDDEPRVRDAAAELLRTSTPSEGTER